MTGLSIMGLLPPGGYIVGGSIKLDGRELVGLNDDDLRQVRGNEIAMIFQDPLTSLNPTKTIGDQVAEPVRLHRGASKAEALDRAVEVLGLVGLPRPKERLRDYPHQLSGGLRQRVMIAMALACEPKLLIADEPTTALDVTIQAQILALLEDLKERLGMAMLLVTHDMGVIAGRADRVNVMYAGRVVETAEARYAVRATCGIPTPRRCSPRSRSSTRTRGRRCTPSPACRPTWPGRRRAAGSPRGAPGHGQVPAEEPSLAGKTFDHRFACWHPVDGPLALTVIGEAGPDAASTGLVASDAESVSQAAQRRRWATSPMPLFPSPGRPPGLRTGDVRAARRGRGRPQGDARRPPGGGGAHGRGRRRERRGPLLQVEHLVKELPGHVRRGAAAQGRRASARSPTSASRSSPERRSAWSASPAAARPRSAG